MSVIKHKDQRVGIFIDTQNLYHSAKNIYNTRVNFDQVVKDGLAGRQLIRAVAYVITTEAGDEKNFFEALGKMGIETKTKNLQIFSGGAKKADWDVGLAVDAIKLAPEGCQVEVMSFGKSSSSKLIEVCDDFIDLDLAPSKYLLGFGGDKRNRRTPRATQK
jgi:uncharacterized LabA/DUF88 family protein